MNARLIRPSSATAFPILVAVLAATELWVVSVPQFARSGDVVSVAVAVDLVIGIPLLGYLCLVRPGRAQPWVLAPLFILGFVVARLILPAEHRAPLQVFEWVLPLVELGLVAFLVYRGRAVMKAFRRERSGRRFAIDAFEASLRGVLGSRMVAGILTTELTLPYYAVAGWFKRFELYHEGERSFEVHNRGGYPAILVAVTMAMVAETLAIHLLVFFLWSPVAAWILTALSVYSLLWILGDFNAMRLHPILVQPNRLLVRVGFRWRVDVPLDAIVAIRDDRPEDEGLAVVPIGTPDFWLELERPFEVSGLFGMQKSARFLGLGVKDGRELRALLEREVVGAEQAGHDGS